MKKIWLVLFMTFLLFKPSLLWAAEDGEMAIYPYEWDGQNENSKYWFLYNLDKGQSKEDKVVVENLGSSPLAVKIYPVDATTTSDGAFALRNEDEPKQDIGAWVKVTETEVNLEPHEKKAIDFSITIPNDVSVGDHAGGIIIENKEIKQGQQINVKTRVGVRILEKVPGEIINKISLSDIKAQGKFTALISLFYDWNFAYSVKNEGNVQTQPTIDVKISSPWFGNVYSDQPQLKGYIIPGQAIEQKFSPDKTLYFGPYQVTVNTQSENTTPVQKTFNIWVMSWKLILIAILLLLVLVTIFAKIFSKTKKPESIDFFVDRPTINPAPKPTKPISVKTTGKKTVKKIVKKPIAKKTATKKIVKKKPIPKKKKK